ncbi:MAG TPA: ABC transporter substrate-binding protein [Stellaceae bacterium]|jgi:NitT/TauT family transport system substrate-binding protein|nr:ABC transporter substrate-binding protein [Stellaceae bacterium]
MKLKSRVCFIALTAFLAVSSAHAAEKLPVGKAALTSSAVLPVDIGVKAGIFARHGLDVEIVVFQGAAKMHQAMLAGSVDLGIGGGPEMALIAKGAPELAVCNVAPEVAFLGILVPGDSPIRNVADLKGKKMAVAAVGGLAYWLTLELDRREGWGPKGMDIVEIGNSPASVVASLKTRAVDAAYTGTVLAFTMEEEGTGRLLIPASKYAGHVGGGVIYATKRIMAGNPDAIRRFLAGWLETIAYMRAHRDESVAVEREVTHASAAVQGKEFDLNLGAFSNDCRFDAETLANLKRSFADLKLTDTPPDMASLYTEKFLP